MREIKYWRAFQEGLSEEMRRDPTILYFGEDAGGKVGGPFALAKGLQDEFGGKRVYETPDSEAGYVGLAIGLAATGYRPVVDISFMDFTLMAIDQIVNMAAKIRYMSGGVPKALPLVIHTMAGGGRRAGAQHSQSLEAWFAHIPGLKVIAPSNPYDLKGALKSALRDDNPVLVMKHKAILGMKGEVPEGEYTVPLGKAFVKKEGTDATIVAVSHMVNVSLHAAAKLEEEGISVEVVDPLSLSPLDRETIVASVRKTGRLVTVHEAWKPCGMGAEIGAVVFEECFDFLQAPLVRIASSFNPFPYSPGMEDFTIPGVSRVVEGVRKVLES
ncbi:alpha-ketoacid dehydrogenase subunit beta [Candidatus Deferrimicrobium sp.]|uniref:alpha-ketoacid dehydrogenase subunit beta n=1 Tax=Candidatus Deferrimicrobium sp. TaxID=3060586 RepID=UPI002717FDCE|nr:alpha-ketoacid dehydrogenase subunit beta [Candidatus Deferrimicrobium sp.]MDO8738834.1 alpha-ketoacid dehydrogenase subunit beta [Candidatus Deferrimicrobium sp.]